MEDSTCESFEPLRTLDLPYVPGHVVEPKSSEPITSKESNSVTESMSSPIPASVTHKLSQVYSRRKAAPELTQVQESNSESENEITVRSDPPLHTHTLLKHLMT